TGTETSSSEKISDDKLELFKTHAASSSIYEQNNYYRNKLQIVFSTFTRNEGIYESSDEIPNPRDSLKLWYITDGSAPLHAYKIQVNIKSLSSRREKSTLMEFKSDSMGPYYCSKFIPNEKDNDESEPTLAEPTTVGTPNVMVAFKAPIKAPLKSDYIHPNLIKNKRGINSKENFIACFDAESYTRHLFSLYSSNIYFTSNGLNNYVGYAIDKDYYEIVNGEKKINSETFPECANQSTIDQYVITVPTTNFLKAGGAELIVAQPGGATKTIKNQADWLIVDAHGSTSVSTGGIAWTDSNNKIHRLHPYELITNKISSYKEDLEVLVLLTCYSLKWQFDITSITHSRGWQKVLPEGVILGFQQTSHDKSNRDAIFLINNAISYHTAKFTQKELSDMWFLANALIYKNYLINKNNIYYKDFSHAANVATIYNNYWNAPNLNTENDESNLVTTNGICPFNFRKYRGIYNDNTSKSYYEFADFINPRKM
ncbi:MAG: hypothetical protein GYA62_09035, partial [Bacteroidales bacterium]|nr:hypothetical protein [Bacteroidales bacterium]